MTLHRYPYKSLFAKYVYDLGEPDEDGWATGSCPYCGDSSTFRVNLISGRWVCLPTPIKKSNRTPADSDVEGYVEQSPLRPTRSYRRSALSSGGRANRGRESR